MTPTEHASLAARYTAQQMEELDPKERAEVYAELWRIGNAFATGQGDAPNHSRTTAKALRVLANSLDYACSMEEQEENSSNSEEDGWAA